MAIKETKSSDTAKVNPALAWHFARIKGDLSFAALRKKMADEGFAIGSSTLQRIALGEPGARLESLNKLAMFAKMAPEDLLKYPDEDEGEFVEVQRVEVRLSAGGGATATPYEVVGGLAFRRSFLTDVGVSAEDARIVDVHGSSMFPTIHDGSVLLISTKNSAKQPMHNKIFALIHPVDGLLVKRLMRDGDLWYAHSDNPAYKPIAISDGEPISILGRAMWMAVKLD
ncbi:S24 family peptidase [Comamonas sp.]|uniref:S24 family peptidase n=1 Tax=Comamonas sp. TaxID=34028 RepID=UPI0028970BA0|nr:S24 family peptidase [Comamonas sp.]